MPTTGTIQSLRVWATGSIASGAAISNDIDLMGYRPAAFDCSSGWDAANKTTFRVSQDATTWYDLYTDLGAEYQFASGVLVSATSRCIVPSIDLSLALQAHKFMRVKSAANLTTGFSFSVLLVPM